MTGGGRVNLWLIALARPNVCGQLPESESRDCRDDGASDGQAERTGITGKPTRPRWRPGGFGCLQSQGQPVGTSRHGKLALAVTSKISSEAVLLGGAVFR